MFIAAINSNRKEKTFCTETQTNKFERITCKYLQCKEETVAPIAIESEIILSKKAKKIKMSFYCLWREICTSSILYFETTQNIFFKNYFQTPLE